MARRPLDRREFPPQRPPHGLAAEHELARLVPVAAEQPGVDQLPRVGRREVHEVDPVSRHVVHQRLGVQPDVLVDHVQLVPCGEQQQPFQGGVEREGRGERAPDPSGTAPAQQLVPGEQGDQLALLDHHALRSSGRPGGVDDVGGVRGPHLGRRGGVRPALGSGVRHHRDGFGVAEQELDPLRGQGRVHRQVRATGLQHRQDRHDDLVRSGQLDRHESLRPDSGGDQLVRQPVGPVVQLLEAQCRVTEHQRGGLRGAGRLLREDLGQPQLGYRRGRVVPVLGELPRLGPGQQGQLVDGPVRGLGHGGQQQHEGR